MIIVLHQAQIPQNTGNIIRTCAATAVDLALIEPIGFEINDKQLKRAGLDYWTEANFERYPSLEIFLEKKSPSAFSFFSSKASKAYTELKFQKDHALIFGSESHGLPEKFFKRWPEQFYRIPMRDKIRCLNLSNAAAIVVYEGLRQQNFVF